MALFKRRSSHPPSLVGIWVGGSGDLPSGYHRLIDSPEVAACINRISAIVSSATVYLMENRKLGDTRIHDGMSRLVRENCDFRVSIPMKGQISSLNASAAASVLLYEAVRQRG